MDLVVLAKTFGLTSAGVFAGQFLFPPREIYFFN
jgi:hypothetical protein